MGLAQNIREAYTTGGLGIRVNRDPAALGIVQTSNLFTITGAPVYINLLIGEVVTVLETAATTIRLEHINSVTTGQTGFNSAALNVSAEPAGTIWVFGDLFGTSPLLNTDCYRPVANYLLGSMTGTLGIMAPPGIIRLILAGADSTTGTVRWTLFYVPMFRDALVVPN